jgi:two-component system nitrogen regulation response regulator NtrX
MTINPANHEILIVDDEVDICKLIADIMQDEGYKTRYVHGSLEALNELAVKQPSLLLLDIWLEGSQLDGLGVLEIVRQKYPDLPVLMISGHGNIETAVSSIQMGAYDFIEKPFKEERLTMSCSKAIERADLQTQNIALKAKVIADDKFIGKSSAVSGLMGVVEKYAETNSRIFIQGATGSGKKHFARYVHNKSDRKDRPLIIFSPANYSEETIEVEIFGRGVEQEATFGTETAKQSIFEKARGGTLVFDEITNFSTAIQSKLLKALATNKFKRIGSEKVYDIDCRIVSTTSKKMEDEVAAANFKGDLYYRLNVVNVVMPSLKERRDDIPALCTYFLKSFAKISGKTEKKMSDEAISALQGHEWAGNISQLRNIVEWLTIMSPKTDSEIIEITSLASDVFSSVPSIPNSGDVETNADIMSMPLRDARELFEKQYLLAQVNRFGGNISKTSAFIGMERSALHRKLKSLNVHDIRKKGSAEGDDEDVNSDVEELVHIA